MVDVLIYIAIAVVYYLIGVGVVYWRSDYKNTYVRASEAFINVVFWPVLFVIDFVTGVVDTILSANMAVFEAIERYRYNKRKEAIASQYRVREIDHVNFQVDKLSRDGDYIRWEKVAPSEYTGTAYFPSRERAELVMENIINVEADK